MVIFHSYVSLPDGTSWTSLDFPAISGSAVNRSTSQSLSATHRAAQRSEKQNLGGPQQPPAHGPPIGARNKAVRQKKEHGILEKKHGIRATATKIGHCNVSQNFSRNYLGPNQLVDHHVPINFDDHESLNDGPCSDTPMTLGNYLQERPI